MNKKKIFLLISSVFLFISVLSFFLTGETYKGNGVTEKPLLLELAFGKGDKDISYALVLAFVALFLGFISSVLVFIFKEKTAYTHFVIAVGLVFGIIVFFTLSLSKPNFAETKMGIGSILCGCSAILGSVSSLISTIKK